MKRLKILLHALAAAALITSLASISLAGQIVSYDFEGPVPDDWSTSRTIGLKDGKALGPFNSRHPRLSKKASLDLTGLPQGENLNLSFDLVLIGSWDSEGKLADSFTVNAGGKELFTMTSFPCQIKDDDEEQPIGNAGLVKTPISNRNLGYWIAPVTLQIPASLVKDGSLEIEFTAKVSARKVESWALDNVKVSTVD